MAKFDKIVTFRAPLREAEAFDKRIEQYQQRNPHNSNIDKSFIMRSLMNGFTNGTIKLDTLLRIGIGDGQ